MFALFLAPHRMRRGHQEKHPVYIVRSQRTEQGVGPPKRSEVATNATTRLELRIAGSLVAFQLLETS